MEIMSKLEGTACPMTLIFLDEKIKTWTVVICGESYYFENLYTEVPQEYSRIPISQMKT